jgi:hypothetical protein
LEDTIQEIHRIGHRAFVGGNDQYWEQIGELQYRFLIEHGLTPNDVFFDVACGSLRGGTRFIGFLEPGHYFGIDRYIELIIYGVANELGIERYAEKKPRFVVSDSFEFHKLAVQPTFAIAQSLFTHLTERDILRCLSNLRQVAGAGCRFFATFHEVGGAFCNPPVSHSCDYFAYTRSQMEELGLASGWTPRYLGEWKHPREQKMIEYVAVS